MTGIAPPLLQRIDWHAAACRGDRTSDWTADTPSERARELCRRCPIVDACLAYAVAADEELGLWGGLDRMEREEYRKALIERAGTDADPVAHYLRRLVVERRRELCPRCRVHHMQAGARMCGICEQRAQEVRDASKRHYFHRRKATAEELPQRAGYATTTEWACAWLNAVLRDEGPQDAAALKARAKDAGISSSTLGRARERIGAHAVVEYPDQGGSSGRRSTWMLDRDRDRTTERATCLTCSTEFIRDVVPHGRPSEFCSDTCRKARARTRARARQGPSLAELSRRFDTPPDVAERGGET